MADVLDCSEKVDPRLKEELSTFSPEAVEALQKEIVWQIEGLLKRTLSNAHDRGTNGVSDIDVIESRERLRTQQPVSLWLRLGGSAGMLLLGGSVSFFFALPTTPKLDKGTMAAILAASIVGAVLYALDMVPELLRRIRGQGRPYRRPAPDMPRKTIETELAASKPEIKESPPRRTVRKVSAPAGPTGQGRSSAGLHPEEPPVAQVAQSAAMSDRSYRS